ncbi:MAG: DUF1292 domain-containing protein [Clostridia bacterium]|nr:DUF1292 domain-containing protein [Clostridia bacterium]
MSQEENKVILTDETGHDHEFDVLDVLEIGDNEYCILLPLDYEVEEAIILKIGLDESGDEVLFEIEEDDEWEMVAETWRGLVESENNGESS